MLEQILIPCTLFIACGCVMPVMIVKTVVKAKMHRTEKQNELLIAALDKNPNVDVERLVKQLNVSGGATNHLIKERLLNRLMWGSILGSMGLGIICVGIYMQYDWYKHSKYFKDDFMVLATLGLIVLGVGIGFLVNYFVSMKKLSKEMEIEQQNMIALGKYLEK